MTKSIDNEAIQNDPALIICGIDELDNSRLSGISFDCVVSLVDPGLSLPSFPFEYDKHRRFDFHDAVLPDDEKSLPTLSIVKHALEELSTIDKDTGLVLLHCQMGRSRSAALGLAFLYMTGNNEQQCYEKLKLIRDPTWPNSLMLKFADQLLGSHLDKLLRDHFEYTANNHPEFADKLRRSPRSFEVPEV